jgi:hypothetical protein
MRALGPPVQVIFVPVPVAGQNGGWQKPPPMRPYPSQPRRPQWPPRQAIPSQAAVQALADARRRLAIARGRAAGAAP